MKITAVSLIEYIDSHSKKDALATFIKWRDQRQEKMVQTFDQIKRALDFHKMYVMIGSNRTHPHYNAFNDEIEAWAVKMRNQYESLLHEYDALQSGIELLQIDLEGTIQ